MQHPNTRLTWCHQVRKHARYQPDRAALKHLDRTTTWAQLDDRVRRLASALAERGVEAGDRVLMVVTNRAEFVETLLAVNWLSAIAVPVNFRLVADEVAYLADNSGATAIVVEEPLAPLVGGIRAENAVPCLVIGDATDGAGPGAELYEPVIGDAEPYAGEGPQDLLATAFIMYTSGTTGRPKGAMLSYENLLGQTLTGVLSQPVGRPEDVNAIVAPMFHIAALGTMLPNLIAGNTQVIMPTGAFDVETYLDLMERERVSHCFLVPVQWQMVCASPTLAERDLALRVLTWGAAPATPAILRAMTESFPDAEIVAAFGQTELSPVTCLLTGEDAIRKLGSVGRPVPLVDVRVVDPEMNDVRPGEVGEIVYRGPQVMQGYWQNPQATEEAFRGGWFHSGDLVRVDEDGFYYVVDRLKDMIISGGENIYCAEVEAVLADHPKVLDVALVGRPDATWGETPVAIVVPKDPADPPSRDELVAYSADRLASYKKPSDVLVLDAMPRNASGKILKGPLRELAAQR